jgi:NADPH:quinone reductase-like Zn-dependent oxidoreductase
MAGSIVAVGDGVQAWNAGDRVCANFAIDHVAGPSYYTLLHAHAYTKAACMHQATSHPRSAQRGSAD